MKDTDPKIAIHSRLTSLDAFRGLVIIIMIFVNYCAGLKDIPSWLYHATATEDRYTFVDLVFPGFLLITGVSIPFSFKNKTDCSYLDVFKRLFLRTSSLVFLGVVMVSLPDYSSTHSGISKHTWQFFFYSSVFLLWTKPFEYQNFFNTARIVAALIILYLLFIFRKEDHTWLSHSWWGILGKIGWASLGASLIYMLCGNKKNYLWIFFGLILTIYINRKHSSSLDFLSISNDFFPLPTIFGTHTLIVLTGVMIGVILIDSSSKINHKCYEIITLGIGLTVMGYLIRPLHTISKIQGTDAYALVSSGINCLSFCLLYFLIEAKGLKSPKMLVSIGKNPIVAYLMPNIFSSLFYFLGLPYAYMKYGVGIKGLANCLALTFAMIALTHLFTKLKITPRL